MAPGNGAGGPRHFFPGGNNPQQHPESNYMPTGDFMNPHFSQQLPLPPMMHQQDPGGQQQPPVSMMTGPTEPSHMGTGGSGSIKESSGVSQRRPTPYTTSPNSYIQNKMKQPHNQNPNFGGQQFPGGQQQQPLPSPGAYGHFNNGPPYMQHGTGGPPYMQHNGPYPQPPNYAPQGLPQGHNYMGFSQQQQNSIPNFNNGMYTPRSPTNGAPMPPMTPGSNHHPNSPPPNMQPDIAPYLPDIKSELNGPGVGGGEGPPVSVAGPGGAMGPGWDELRLNIPLRVVIPPFRLDHNLASTTRGFHLDESAYGALMSRKDVALTLRCFHHENPDRGKYFPEVIAAISINSIPLDISRFKKTIMKNPHPQQTGCDTTDPHTNPQAASVSANVKANSPTIEHGSNKVSNKSPDLKNGCRSGINTIQITVTACCCAYFFVLQMVHQPSISAIIQGLRLKCLLSVQHSKIKIQYNFSRGVKSTPINLNGDEGVEKTDIKVSLKCPITDRRITLPARGHDCTHIQCFDLTSYLEKNCEHATWRCPVCNKSAVLEGLEIDQLMEDILQSLEKTAFEEVAFNLDANWKPVQINQS